jgi:hypothetical protein
MVAGQGISVEIKRGGAVTSRLSPSFTFQGGADRPNFSECHFFSRFSISVDVVMIIPFIPFIHQPFMMPPLGLSKSSLLTAQIT